MINRDLDSRKLVGSLDEKLNQNEELQFSDQVL